MPDLMHGPQIKLEAREEELQEARLLQDGLVKELGIIASRYSRLAVDVQEGSERAAAERAVGIGGERGSNQAVSSCTRRSSLSSMLAAVYPLTSLGLGSNNFAAVSVCGGESSASGVVSGCHSVPLPAHIPAMMLSSRQPTPSLSTNCTATIRTSTSHATLPTTSTCGKCCQQLLALLSESEVHRASLLESNQGLNEKVEELTAGNNMLYGQLQQMLAEGSALEPLLVGELEDLERKLDCSTRAVRAALTQRKIDEAQRRRSSEQAACAVCMEYPKAIVFNCGHQSCEPCAGKVTTCPFCRVQIAARIRLFDA